MGSGLILFVIVGAWLAVLVPMGLRSHDDAAPSRSVERFNDAMRVLSRRAGGPAEGGVQPEADDPTDGSVAVEWAPSTGLRGSALRLLDAATGARAALTDRLPRRLPALPRRRRPAAPPVAARSGRSATRSTAAARRRRVLLALGALAVLGLVAALVVPAALLVTVASGLLAAAFGWHCRSRSRARAAWQRNRAAVEAELSRRPVAEPARPARVPAQERRTRPAAPAVQLFDAAAPDPAPADQLFDLSAYEAPLTVPPAGVAPAARAAAAPAARAALRAALGAEWQPVPVPLPTYVGKAAAPARPARPSAQREQRQAHDAVLDDPGEQRPEVVERGRAPPPAGSVCGDLGAVAQSGSAPRSHRGGQGFESPQLHPQSRRRSPAGTPGRGFAGLLSTGQPGKRNRVASAGKANQARAVRGVSTRRPPPSSPAQAS